MSTVTDHIKKTKTITHYDYDAFGRRTLVQDEGGKIIRTLYDGLSFDIIREQETFADGYFTNTSDTGIAWGAVSGGDGSRYRYIGDDASAAKEQNGYSVTATNRASSRVALYANGQAVGVTRSSNYASSERSYFGTDLLGTVRSATRDSGSAQYYNYDVFGKPLGENISDYAYTGKPYDPTTGMYNYGYRDYSPQTARFTTVDPIRDGSNWFVYCNNEPVNFLDAWGLSAWDGVNPALKSMVEESYKWPVDNGRITTVYGPTTPADTNQGKSNPNHQGIDIAPSVPGTTGQDINASARGIVTSVETDNASGYGTTVTILHPDGNTSRYSHLDSTTVKKGQIVGQSDVIGTLGNTGKSGGAHLDFRVTDENGNYIDPLELLPERPETITVEEKWVTIKEDGTLCNK